MECTDKILYTPQYQSLWKSITWFTSCYMWTGSQSHMAKQINTVCKVFMLWTHQLTCHSKWKLMAMSITSRGWPCTDGRVLFYSTSYRSQQATDHQPLVSKSSPAVTGVVTEDRVVDPPECCGCLATIGQGDLADLCKIQST